MPFQRRFRNTLTEQALWIYMFQPIFDTAMNKNVQGFCFNPDDQFHVRTVYIGK